MYREIPHEILCVIEPIVLDHGLELVDASLAGAGGRRALTVVLDTPEGDGRVTVDECAAVSREVGRALEVADVVPGSYTLEVSSPGVDRILARDKDFARAVGSRVAVHTRRPLDGRRNFRGRLVDFAGDELRVATEGGTARIPLAAVSRANAFHDPDSRGAGRSGQG